MDWLLERQGFAVLLRAYKHDGPLRRKSAGRLQLGADILASKADDDGVERLYRFVLKSGAVGRGAFNRAGEVGNIISDIHEAARRSRTRDAEDHGFPREAFERVTVIAVHNGDFDSESLGGSRDELADQLQRDGRVDLDWWDANELVRRALLPPVDGNAAITEGADSSFFAPALQPYVRLALDGIRVRKGYSFDLAAIDGLLDAMLPVTRHYDDDERPDLARPESLEALELRRLLGALVVFVEMLRVESRSAANGLTLPVLDSIERILARVAIYLGAVDKASHHVKYFRDHIGGLIQQYVRTAADLRDRLQALLVRRNILVLATHSEFIDYPLRVLRFAGYLATAGLAALEAEAGRAEATAFAEVLQALWTNESEACAGPVTDDQMIEIGLALELLLRLERKADVATMCNDILTRFVVRRQHGQPLPAAHQHASVPMSDHDIRDLLEAYMTRDTSAIEDGASTMLPLVLFLLHRVGIDVPADEVLRVFEERNHDDAPKQKACHMQSWQPPNDVGRRWYMTGGVQRRGIAKIFHTAPANHAFPGFNVSTVADLAREFEAFAQPIARSIAEEWDAPVIDRMAWKVFRARPPMHLFVELTRLHDELAEKQLTS